MEEENGENMKIGVFVPKDLADKMAKYLLAVGYLTKLAKVFDAMEEAAKGLAEIQEALIDGGLDEDRVEAFATTAFVTALGEIILLDKLASALEATENRRAAESAGAEEAKPAEEGAKENGGGVDGEE